MKGIDLLTRGMERLRRDAGVPAELLLVGQEQSESAAIVARARTRLGGALHVRANLPHRLMPEVYRAADAFALCSPFEPFGIAFIEAMASGVPVLGNRVHPTVSIIGGGGLAADVLSPARTAAALERLLAPDAREVFGKPGRRRALETYSAAVVVGQIVDLYAELAGGGRT